MRLSTFACIMATAADAAAVGLAVATDPSAIVLTALVVVHLAASLLFSRILVKLLPLHYRQPPSEAKAFVFGAIVFVPVLAMIGFLATLVPALCRQRAALPPVLWLHPRAARLPTQAAEPNSKNSFFWAGSLAGTLQNAPDPNKRIAALIATLSIKEQDAVPLWRWALKDPEDEVRLLAYALLNRKEKAIEERIRKTQAEMGNASADDVFTLHKALAHDFWELSQLAKSRSSTQLSLCARAREQVESALMLKAGNGGLRLLLGRILLAERQLDAASEALRSAQDMGVDARQIEPLLAEIAFIEGRYPDVGGHVRRAGPGRSATRIGTATGYWEGADHAASRA